MAESLMAWRFLVIAATALFAGLVLVIFVRMSSPCDLHLYHVRAQTARAAGILQLYQTEQVEYPPLAIALTVAAEWGAERLTVPPLLARYSVYQRGDPAFLRFKLAFRLIMAGCTLLSWMLFLTLLYGHFGQETLQEWTERMLAFAVALGPMGYVLLDRLDIGLVALVMAALVLLLNRRHWIWSLGFLAAAIGFKFVPVALVPIWLLPPGPGPLRRVGRLLASGLVRGIILAGFLAVLLVPFWFLTGAKCLEFFHFHQERGIEYQSNYAAVLGLFNHAGYPVRIVSGKGSGELVCTATPVLFALAGWLVGAGLMVGAGVLVWTQVRCAGVVAAPWANAHLILGHTLWALLIFVLFNKVFSPQYVLWLVPLCALVPMTGWRRRLFQGSFVGVVYLTMLIFPRHVSDVTGPILPTTPPSSMGATPFGTGLLLARLLLLIVLTVLLAGELLRRARRPRFALAVPAPQQGSTPPVAAHYQAA